MEKPCWTCTHCYKLGCLGQYKTLFCDIYLYLEAWDNPHHNLDGSKCPDYEYNATGQLEWYEGDNV